MPLIMPAFGASRAHASERVSIRAVPPGLWPAVSCQNGVMTDIARRDALASRPIRILLYSDDANTREKVRLAVGPTIEGRQVQWAETATHEGTIMQADTESFDLMVLDGEAAKSGGLGLARQFKHELYTCPPILVLVGRVGDAWLATWSEADAAVAHPLDPFEVKAAVDAFFAPAPASA